MEVLKNEITQGLSTVCLYVNPTEFNRFLENAYVENANHYHVSGYIAGLAPREKIEEIYGHDALYQEALDLCTTEIYGEFIKEQELRIIGQPQIIDVTWPQKGGVIFTITCELFPDISLGEYTGLTTTLKREDNEDIFASDILSKARENLTVEIPSGFIEQRLNALITQEKAVICKYAQDILKERDPQKSPTTQNKLDNDVFTSILASMQLTPEQWLNQRREQIYQMIRLEFLLDAVAEKEKLCVSTEELESEYYFLADQNGLELDEAIAKYDFQLVKENLLREKARLFILDHAVSI